MNTFRIVNQFLTKTPSFIATIRKLNIKRDIGKKWIGRNIFKKIKNFRINIPSKSLFIMAGTLVFFFIITVQSYVMYRRKAISTLKRRLSILMELYKEGKYKEFIEKAYYFRKRHRNEIGYKPDKDSGSLVKNTFSPKLHHKIHYTDIFDMEMKWYQSLPEYSIKKLIDDPTYVYTVLTDLNCIYLQKYKYYQIILGSEFIIQEIDKVKPTNNTLQDLKVINWIVVSDMYMKSGQITHAIILLSNLMNYYLENHPEPDKFTLAIINIKLLTAYVLDGQLEKSRDLTEALRGVVKSIPSKKISANFCYLSGCRKVLEGQYKEAIEHFNDVLALYEDFGVEYSKEIRDIIKKLTKLID